MLRQRLYEDGHGYNRYEIAEHLLKYYGTPSDYKFVKDYQPNELDVEMKEWIESDLTHFMPIGPIDSTISMSKILDTLTSYTNQCYGYEWLKDETYKMNY